MDLLYNHCYECGNFSFNSPFKDFVYTNVCCMDRSWDIL